MINYIVDKIIAGGKKWSPEELQVQKNYPELIELELKKKQMHTPICSKDDSYLISHIIGQRIKSTKQKPYWGSRGLLLLLNV